MKCIVNALVVFALLAGAAFAQVPSQSVTSARPDWSLPPDEFVEIDGYRIHYFAKGTGPTLLLLHGLIGSAGYEFGRVIDLLAASHRVIVPHHVGFAPSDRPNLKYDAATFVACVAGVIRALKLQDVTLVGESFGGWVAVNYALAGDQGPSTLPRIKAIAIVAGTIGAGPPPSGARPIFDPEVRLEAGQYMKSNPFLDNELMRPIIVQNSGMARNEPSPEELARIGVPTLVLWGDKDELVPLSIGEKLAAAIPGARLVVLPNVGHAVAIEQPREFARIIGEFAR